MWWIRHTEAGYYANMVGRYVPPLYGVSTTVVRIGLLACFFFVSSATKRSVWPSVMIPLYSRVKEAKVSKCKQS